jgi:hypothetical protein
MLLTKEDGDIKEEKAKCRLCSRFAPESPIPFFTHRNNIMWRGEDIYLSFYNLSIVFNPNSQRVIQLHSKPAK